MQVGRDTVACGRGTLTRCRVRARTVLGIGGARCPCSPKPGFAYDYDVERSCSGYAPTAPRGVPAKGAGRLLVMT